MKSIHISFALLSCSAPAPLYEKRMHVKVFPERRQSAIFSECIRDGRCTDEACKGRLYRYFLAWPTKNDTESVCLWILANPSTASAEKTDPTVAKCINYTKRWGYGWCHVVNVRAWRATDPKDVPADPEAIGPENDDRIVDACGYADLLVCGWGRLGGKRGLAVLKMIRPFQPHALKINIDGSPAHPLYLGNALKPRLMEMPR